MRFSSWRWIRVVTILGLLIGVSETAEAATATYSFTGTVQSSTLTTVVAGNHFSGTFSYNTNDLIATQAGYPSGFFTTTGSTADRIVVNVSTATGTLVFQSKSGPTGMFQLALGANDAGTDILSLASNTTTSGNALSLQLSLGYPSGGLFTSNPAPNPVNINQFTLTDTYLFSADPFFGELDSIAFVGLETVPEPSGVILLGVGVLSLLGYSLLRRRKATAIEPVA